MEYDIEELAQRHTRKEILKIVFQDENVEEERKIDPDETIDSDVQKPEGFGFYRRLQPDILERFPVMNR